MSPLVLAALLCAVGIALSGLFSGVETAAYQFHRSRHRLQVAEGIRRALLVESLTADMTTFVAVCLIGTNVANAVVSFSTTLAFEHLQVVSPELISTVTIGPLLFVLGELFPKELFRKHADRLIYATAPAVGLAALLCRPATWLIGLYTRALRAVGLITSESDGAGGDVRLRMTIAAGMEGGTVTRYQATLAENIIALEKHTVARAMIPLEQVAMLEAADELERARAYAIERRQARYPVYRNSRGRVVGLINTYALVFEERPGLTVRNYIEAVPTLAPGDRVVDALVQLRRARTPLAVVVQGEEAIGIVTIKDLVEEITGELTDL